jgi:UDP-GlcNAc:undecaprenyl-phosphate GlcNAc-1-phosphate transferase
VLIAATLATFLGGFFFQKACASIYHKMKVYALPDSRRRHRKPIPMSGGLGICVTALVSLSAAVQFRNVAWNDELKSLLPLFVGAIWLMLVGVVDDKRTISPRAKLICQFAAAAMACYSPGVQNFVSAWSGTFGYFSWALVLIWIVGITNAINFIDGLDGLSGSTIFLTLSMIAFREFHYFEGRGASFVIPVLLAAAVLSFLIFNWQPAKVFLGDTGSLSLGFLLASLPLHNISDRHPWTGHWTEAASILFLLGYPIMDLMWVTARRLKRGQSPLRADRSHLHHRILRLGFTSQGTVILLMMVSFAFLLSSFLILAVPKALSPTVAILSFALPSVILYMIFTINRWKVKQMLRSHKSVHLQPSHISANPNNVVFHIQLAPLIEEQELIEKEKVKTIISALGIVLQTTFSNQNCTKIRLWDKYFEIVLDTTKTPVQHPEALKRILQEKLDALLDLMNVSTSLKGLRVNEVAELKNENSIAA